MFNLSKAEFKKVNLPLGGAFEKEFTNQKNGNFIRRSINVFLPIDDMHHQK